MSRIHQTKLDKETSFNLAIFNKIVTFKDAEFSGEVKEETGTVKLPLGASNTTLTTKFIV